MNYAEIPLPVALRGLVAALWTLECNGAPDDELTHEATPDGCIELIRRTRGQSFWRRPQPPVFVTGLSANAATLQLSGDACFIGLRLWPWAWNVAGAPSAPALADDWADAGAFGALIETASFDAIEQVLAGRTLHPVAAATLGSDSVGEIVDVSGASHRQVQRWFAREVGIPPLKYLGLLRFGRAIRNIQHDKATLADHAADAGYADQAHMARSFRSFAGDATRSIRKRASGPFI